MNAVTAPKSDRMNRLEGFALIALLQGFPIFASTVLLMKLMGSHQIVGDIWRCDLRRAGHPGLRVGHAGSGPQIPEAVSEQPRAGFYDAGLRSPRRFAQWRTQPKASSHCWRR